MSAGQHHLERDGAFQGQMTGLVDDAHAAAAEYALDHIAGDGRRRRLGRRGRAAVSGILWLWLVRDRGLAGQRWGRLPDLRGGPGVVANALVGWLWNRGRGVVAGPQRIVGVR